MLQTMVLPFGDISPSEKDDPKTIRVPTTIIDEVIKTLVAKSRVIIGSSFLLGGFRK